MQIKKRKALGGLYFFLMMFCMFGAGLVLPEAKKAEASPSEFRESVVMVVESVRFLGTKSYREISYGSGFFVGNPGEKPMYLVTNHHVIENYLNLGRGRKRLLTDYQKYYDKARIEIFYDDKDSVEAYPVAYDEHADVAILRIEKATDKRKPMAVREPDDSMVGSAVYACGFPGIAANDEKDAVSQRSVSDVSVTSGLISRLLTQHATGVREIQTDTDFWHGNSGGPLVLESGVAIGITANYYLEVKRQEREELNYAVSMAEVIPMLKNNNIPYTTESILEGGSSSDGSESSGESSGSETGISSSEVISSSEAGSSLATSSEEKEGAGGLNTTMIIVIAAAAVVVVVLIVIIVLVAKKKPEESRSKVSMNANEGINLMPQPMGNPSPMNMAGMGNPSPMNMGAQQPRPMDFNLSVQGVSGLFAGRTYTQGRDGRIMFGRQPSCQVVFGGNDKNVSGNHCVLYKQDGGVMLMDLGSTNGTYLENGTRLQANVAYALHAGERFYLVNKNYMFMIK